MGYLRQFSPKAAMASPWRRQSLCVLIDTQAPAPRPCPATLREVSGAGAAIGTLARPPIGHVVELHHPEAGMIRGEIVGFEAEGLRIAFDRSGVAVSFALAAIAADMTIAG